MKMDLIFLWSKLILKLRGHADSIKEIIIYKSDASFVEAYEFEEY